MKTFLLATVVVAFALPAHAVTVSVISSGTDPAFDPGIPAGQTIFEDFEGGDPGTITGDYAIALAPGTPGVSAAPSGTAAGTGYLTVPSDTPGDPSGDAVFMFDGEFSEISFYWGSVDNYNSLDLLDKDGNIIASYTGATLPAAVMPDGNQTDFDSNVRVNFAIGAGDAFIGGVHMTSTQFAFEADTFAGIAVPEPGMLGLLGLGIGLLGATRRRKTA